MLCWASSTAHKLSFMFNMGARRCSRGLDYCGDSTCGDCCHRCEHGGKCNQPLKYKAVGCTKHVDLLAADLQSAWQQPTKVRVTSDMIIILRLLLLPAPGITYVACPASTITQ